MCIGTPLFKSHVCENDSVSFIMALSFSDCIFKLIDTDVNDIYASIYSSRSIFDLVRM